MRPSWCIRSVLTRILVGSPAGLGLALGGVETEGSPELGGVETGGSDDEDGECVARNLCGFATDDEGEAGGDRGGAGIKSVLDLAPVSCCSGVSILNFSARRLVFSR